MKNALLVLLLVTVAGCSADAPPAAAMAKTVAEDGPVILVVGDSLSAGYGIEHGAGWVDLLQQRLDGAGHSYNIINASVTGDTTAGGLTRLKLSLEQFDPVLVIIELGGNDGLRAIPLQVVESNIFQMIELSQAAGARVALLGMRIPTNYGVRYTEQFHQIYKDAARRYDVPLVEFFLDGVALNPDLMLADGIHPNAAAQPVLLDNAWPAISQALGSDQTFD